VSTSQTVPNKVDYKRLFFLFLGVFLFAIVYYSPPWPEAVDPMGKVFALQGKAALGLFLLAGTWWVFEVLPIGVTGITIGVVQALFFIRPASDAFKDFMDPSVLFIFGSLMIGAVFTKVGITKRLAYKMLDIVGERTSMIYLGCFVVTALLTHLMAHTAVAATMYPLLLRSTPSTARVTGPPSSARASSSAWPSWPGPAASSPCSAPPAASSPWASTRRSWAGRSTFFELTFYMFPVGWLMVFVLWGFFMIFFKPEKAVIPGLREKARELNAAMGP
jgi:solute carrier family 13 (sodium-dependent dicarboxylate transporter), member 2/3/5